MLISDIADNEKILKFLINKVILERSFVFIFPSVAFLVCIFPKSSTTFRFRWIFNNVIRCANLHINAISQIFNAENFHTHTHFSLIIRNVKLQLYRIKFMTQSVRNCANEIFSHTNWKITISMPNQRNHSIDSTAVSITSIIHRITLCSSLIYRCIFSVSCEKNPQRFADRFAYFEM